ncbi:MAG: MBL fold metallo-hydrolase [Deltaproteobacteria bacterium]|nr:MBL fold metallo-hydrolase [Deltaproteobacteria bacterium]
MFFRPFYRFETGCAAYVFGCGGKGLACVVDPHEADVDAYLEFAASKGMRITHVFDTHVHADHRSGARRLVEATGAKYCLQRSANVAFPFEPVDDGQLIELGNTIIRVLHTPGHTSESMCLVVSDLRRGTEPWFVCTGDTLFVGAVGRPDLPGHERENAALLHTSVRDKLLVLPGDLEVYPAHFAGSACGDGMSGKPASTISFEKKWNGLLALDEAAFVEAVGGAVPPKPDGMLEIMRFNQGRA